MRAALLSVLVLLVAGCGGSAEQSAPPADSVPAEQRGFAWGMEQAYGEPDPGTAAPAERLAVFQRPRRVEDELPASVGAIVPEGAPEGHWPGEPIPDESRLLLADAGRDHANLFAVPTAKGWVCLVLDQARTCYRGLYDGIAWSMGGDETAFRVHGLAADDVLRVEFVVGGERRAARVENNAFFIEIATADACPADVEELVVSKADGTSRRLEVLPAIDEETC